MNCGKFVQILPYDTTIFANTANIFVYLQFFFLFFFRMWAVGAITTTLLTKQTKKPTELKHVKNFTVLTSPDYGFNLNVMSHLAKLFFSPQHRIVMVYFSNKML